MIAEISEGSVPVVDTTVIVLTSNRDQHLDRALASVREQTWTSWELIVSDTSTEPARRAAVEASFHAHVRESHRRSRLLLPPPGLSHAEHLALALATVKTPFIALLDDRDIWMPEHLERNCGWLEHDSRRGLVISNSIIVDQHGAPDGLSHPLSFLGYPEEDLRAHLHHLLRYPFSSMSGIVIRTAALRDHRFFVISCVDVHLCVSTILAGMRIGLLPTPSFYRRVHRNSSNPGRTQAFRDRHLLRLYLAVRHGFALSWRAPLFPLLALKSGAYLASAAWRRRRKSQTTSAGQTPARPPTHVSSR